jgi:hypothetical protein
MGGPLEDKLDQVAGKDDKRDGSDKSGSGRRGSSLGSIMKQRIRSQQQKVEDEDKK